jgi:tRNA pseudouridine55 synthase
MDFKEGEILLVDKPLDWTSFDVVNKLRYNIKRKLNVKKIKVGHAGTLDPRATGLLVLCTGKKTKTIPDLLGADKVYTGTFKLGVTTPSFDTETEEENQKDIPALGIESLQETADLYLGDIEQVPPIFSAVKVDGERAYNLARKGEEVKIKTRQVHISFFKIVDYKPPFVYFETHVSKGTYIRSLANDFGEKIGCGAYLTELRRTKSGDFSIDNSKTVEEWIKVISES